MNYLLWILLGSLCGAALGIIFPVGMTYLVVLTNEKSHGIGTVGSILMLLTSPAGFLFGGFAGWYRASQGSWRGAFSGTTGARNRPIQEAAVLRRELFEFEKELESLPQDKHYKARQIFIKGLEDNLERVRPNYGLLAVWVVVGLLIPIVLIVPFVLLAKHLYRKQSLRLHIRETTRQWSMASYP
ncbi:MAG: hypothetical protein AAGA92_10805 [Planctomycetota bacterium]